MTYYKITLLADSNNPNFKFANPWKISDSGKVIGYGGISGSYNSAEFLYDNGSIKNIVYGSDSSPALLSVSNAGQVLGRSSGENFVYYNGQYTAVQYPGSGTNYVGGFGSNETLIGEYYGNSYGDVKLFNWSGGAYSKLTIPELTTSKGFNLFIGGGSVSSGQIVGSKYIDYTGKNYDPSTSPQLEDFTYVNGRFYTLPDGTISQSIGEINSSGLAIAGDQLQNIFTGEKLSIPMPSLDKLQAYNPVITSISPYGINDAGVVVGSLQINQYYSDQGYTQIVNVSHGFIYQNGVTAIYDGIDDPGAGGARLTDINNSGQIIGTYYGKEDFLNHGFIATPGVADQLFTTESDKVNFNQISASQATAISIGADLYHGRGGNDVVYLPDIGGNSTAIGWKVGETFVTGDAVGQSYTITGGNGADTIQLGGGATMCLGHLVQI